MTGEICPFFLFAEYLYFMLFKQSWIVFCIIYFFLSFFWVVIVLRYNFLVVPVYFVNIGYNSAASDYRVFFVYTFFSWIFDSITSCCMYKCYSTIFFDPVLKLFKTFMKPDHVKNFELNDFIGSKEIFIFWYQWN